MIAVLAGSGAGPAVPEGDKIKNWKPGADLLSGRLFWTCLVFFFFVWFFFPSFKQMTI